MNVNKPAISSVHALRAPGASLGSQQARYGAAGAQGQPGGQGGYVNGARGQTFVAGRSEASINTPQTGGVGSQSRPPRGVSGGIPGGGFGNTGGYVGSSGAPQTGGGDFAKSDGGAGSPQKTTGTQTNPYGKTKYMIEEILRDYVISNNYIDQVIVGVETLSQLADLTSAEFGNDLSLFEALSLSDPQILNPSFWDL